MLIKLRSLPYNDLLRMKDWIMENSPESKLLVGSYHGDSLDNVAVKVVNLENDWAPIKWAAIDKTKSMIPQGFFMWAVDVPNKDAVYFKLVWG